MLTGLFQLQRRKGRYVSKVLKEKYYWQIRIVSMLQSLKIWIVQSSKGVLINMKYIKCIDEDNDVFVMYNNERVPISRRRKKDVIEEYRKFMFDNNR